MFPTTGLRYSLTLKYETNNRQCCVDKEKSIIKRHDNEIPVLMFFRKVFEKVKIKKKQLSKS